VGKPARVATISDVAALAGVSVGTASKALNGRGSLREETRRRVQEAADSLSVAAGALEKKKAIHHPRQEAGQDASIAERLERNPESKEARLDAALDESMDASDPPSSTQPVHSHEPPESSGYDAEEEARLKAEKKG